MRRRLFVAAIVLQAAVLVGWATSLEMARARSGKVRLEVAQRDPRDLLRGDFVLLNYKVSDIPFSAFVSPPSRARPGDRVYVALAPKGAVHEAAAASLSREALPLPPGHRLLVGTLQFSNPRGMHVLYGIERYYVREGKGNPPQGKIEAEVALTGDGHPFLTRLFVDGRPYP